MRKTSKLLMGARIGRNVRAFMKKEGFWVYGGKRFMEKSEVFWRNAEFPGVYDRKSGFC